MLNFERDPNNHMLRLRDLNDAQEYSSHWIGKTLFCQCFSQPIHILQPTHTVYRFCARTNFHSHNWSRLIENCEQNVCRSQHIHNNKPTNFFFRQRSIFFDWVSDGIIFSPTEPNSRVVYIVWPVPKKFLNYKQYFFSDWDTCICIEAVLFWYIWSLHDANSNSIQTLYTWANIFILCKKRSRVCRAKIHMPSLLLSLWPMNFF